MTKEIMFHIHQNYKDHQYLSLLEYETRNFKTTMITMLKSLTEKVDNTHKQKGN